MSKGNIMIAHENKVYTIKVEGRANFECSPAIKNFSDNLTPETIQKIIFDFSSCAWMDSTFMGTLAILGLKSMRLGTIIEIHNADEKNMGLIKDLGIENLFKFVSNEPQKTNLTWKNIPESQENNNDLLAQTVLKAHETLLEADHSNVPKFEKVIELVKKDIQNKIKKGAKGQRD